jgi:hypothetical protein
MLHMHAIIASTAAGAVEAVRFVNIKSTRVRHTLYLYTAIIIFGQTNRGHSHSLCAYLLPQQATAAAW